MKDVPGLPTPVTTPVLETLGAWLRAKTLVSSPAGDTALSSAPDGPLSRLGKRYLPPGRTEAGPRVP